MSRSPQIQPCDSRQLDSYLAGELDGAAEVEVARHLNECDDCRLEMERRAADPDDWREAREMLGAEWPTESNHSEQDGATPERGALPHSIQQAIDLLAPSDDAAMLGRLGAYEVSGVVGAGGMGVVLKAFDKSLDRVVAIKILAPHLVASGAARKRFAREAKAAAAVLHPNVVAIHSVSNDESLPFLVMPYLRGESLQKRIERRGPLPLEEILRISAQVSAGLAAAHAQGLVHRDIKPANILLEEGVERVALTDFGLARAIDDASMTQSGAIAGTPMYMSPEQARGEPIDEGSDLFSLGSVMYAMCTGRPPFRAETSFGVIRRITDNEPTPIRSINPEIPEWLCRIIARLMAKRRADRYASAAETTDVLEACLAHVQQPSSAPLPASLHSPRAFRSSQLLVRCMGVFAMFGLVIWLLSFIMMQNPADQQGSGDEAATAAAELSHDDLEGLWEVVLTPEAAETTAIESRLRLVIHNGVAATFKGDVLESAWKQIAVDAFKTPHRIALEGDNTRRGLIENRDGQLRLTLAPPDEDFPQEFDPKQPEYRRINKAVPQELLDAITSHFQDVQFNARAGNRLAEREDAAPQTWKAHVERLNCFTSGHGLLMACSSDGSRIAVANGNPTRILLEGGASRVKGGWKPTVEIFDVRADRVVLSLKLTTPDEDAILAATPRVSHIEATALSFTPDGGVVAVGTSIGQVKLYDVANGQLLLTIDDEKDRLSNDKAPENWKAMRRALGNVSTLAFSRDGSLLAVGGSAFADVADVFDGVSRLGRSRSVTGPGRLKVWDVKTGALKQDLVGHGGQVSAVAFSPDGLLLASAGGWLSPGGDDQGTGVILWNPETGQKVRTIAMQSNGHTNSVAFAPDGSRLAIGSWAFNKESGSVATIVSLVRAGTGLSEWERTVSDVAATPAFSSDGRSILMMGKQSVLWLDTETGKDLGEIRTNALSKEGRLNAIAVASSDRIFVGAVDDEEGSVESWTIVRPEPQYK